DEADERGQGRARGDRPEDPCRERPTRRIRPGPVRARAADRTPARRGVSWRAFAAGAPALAPVARTRLEDTGVALLGTIRRDGSPRISPIGPVFAEDDL